MNQLTLRVTMGIGAILPEGIVLVTAHPPTEGHWRRIANVPLCICGPDQFILADMDKLTLSPI